MSLNMLKDIVFYLTNSFIFHVCLLSQENDFKCGNPTSFLKTNFSHFLVLQTRLSCSTRELNTKIIYLKSLWLL